jgi:hypothetical protein
MNILNPTKWARDECYFKTKFHNSGKTLSVSGGKL